MTGANRRVRLQVGDPAHYGWDWEYGWLEHLHKKHRNGISEELVVTAN